jgi:hypothetical protein
MKFGPHLEMEEKGSKNSFLRKKYKKKEKRLKSLNIEKQIFFLKKEKKVKPFFQELE